MDRGGSAWSREDQSSLNDRSNYSRAYSEHRDDRARGPFQGGETRSRYNEDAFSRDRPFGEQDRDYRGGSSGYGRSRDYQEEWSGFGSQAGYRGGYESDDDRGYSGGSERSRDRGAAGPGYSQSGASYGTGSSYGSQSRSGYGSQSGSSYGSQSRAGYGSQSGSSYGSQSGSGYGSGSYGSGPWASRFQSQDTSYSGRGPKGYTRSDERIREDVCERLSDNDEVDASEIEVQVRERKVLLTGTVQNRRMKHIAEDLAEAVYGVEDVENRITVTKPFLKDIADRITGNEGEQHFANTGTKNGPSSLSSSGSASSGTSTSSGVQGTNGRA